VKAQLRFMQIKSPFGRCHLLAVAVIAIASLAFVASASAEGFAFAPGSFSTATSNHRAGAHPDLNVKFSIDAEPNGKPIGGTPKDIVVKTPAGLLGAANATPTCTMGKVADVLAANACPLSTAVGEVTLTLFYFNFPFSQKVLLFNIDPYPSEPAAFAFFAAGVSIRFDVSVRSDGDYGLTTTVPDIGEGASLITSDVTFWGVPADHQGPGPLFTTAGRSYGGPGPGPRRAFMTNPTHCDGPLSSSIASDPWQNQGVFSATDEYEVPPLEECEELEFEPTLEARPTTNAADSPSGLNVDLEIPQNEDPDGLATSHMREAEVTLPEGLVVNPSSANGLGACAPAQIGMTSAVGDGQPHFSTAPAACPDNSRLGNAEVITPALDDPLKGSIYLASPQQNPFGSLIGLYVVVEGSGVIAKLAGKVTPNPQTGRLTASFDENPQQPVEDVKLAFDAGAYAPLRTPSTCGKYTTTSVITPWAAPDIPSRAPSDTYEISQGPNGKGCGAPANAPSFEAGSTEPLAGQYKPFVINLRREDASQNFAAVTVSPPPGLVARLAGSATCSDAALAAAAAKTGSQEKASPSCPAASAVGSAYASAGAGPSPYNAPGKVYLAGPYKGAPLSLAIVTPALAGPFDLGTIVVRTALQLNSKTAQVTAVSDPIPTILQGIPLDIRSVSVRLDKSGFTLNPTSCDPSSVDGSLLSSAGSTASLQSRFQLAECGQLKFKPTLSLSLKGASKRGGYPALTAVVKPRAGDANIASASVALPHSEFLAQNHIRTVCTRVQFAADACPARSVYGKVTVTTPLLDYPLSGPVYLRSSDNTLPDLALSLHGPPNQPLRFEAAGRTDSVNGGIRNTFDFVPDVPFTKLVLQLQGGKKGLLENSRDICAAGSGKADATYAAHNGLAYEAEPQLAVKCGGKAKKKAKGKAHRSSRRG
jgi:hypothetical protein